MRAERIPVAGGVVGGEHAHPVFHVRQVFHVRDIVGRVVGIGRVNQRIDIGEIVIRTRRAAQLKIPAVARRFFHAGGRDVIGQCAPGIVGKRDGSRARSRAEFKPRLHFVEPAVGIVGEMFFHHVAVGTLRVFHERAPAMAVDIHRDIAPIEPRHAKRPQKQVRRLLALKAGIVTRAVAGLVNFIERGGTKKFVVVGENPFVMAQAAVGRVETLVIRTAGETRLGVVNNPRVVDHGAVPRFIAQVGQGRPARRVGLREPQMINAETAAGIAVAKHHHALRRKAIVVQQRRKTRRGPARVGGGNVKGDNRTAARDRRGDCAAENAVVCQRIAARAIIFHRHGSVIH